MEYKKVEVEWFDAQHSTHAMYPDELEQLTPLLTKTIGYLVLSKKDFIVLGFVDFGENLFKHHQMIPRKMIRKIRELTYKR